MEKKRPRTYDMTFCVTKDCKDKQKCDRYYAQYEFEHGRLYSMADFNYKEKKLR